MACNRPTLVARYGVERLALFGSTVRDAAQADIDIDIDSGIDSGIDIGIGIDSDTLWSLVASDIPALLPFVRTVKDAAA